MWWVVRMGVSEVARWRRQSGRGRGWRAGPRRGVWLWGLLVAGWQKAAWWFC